MILFGRQAKFIKYGMFTISLQDFRQYPCLEVNAVGDGVKLDLVVVAVAEICHAGVQFTDAIFGFGQLNCQQVWSQVVSPKLLHQPAAHGVAFEVWQY